jgi:hypothetical protein
MSLSGTNTLQRGILEDFSNSSTKELENSCYSTLLGTNVMFLVVLEFELRFMLAG